MSMVIGGKRVAEDRQPVVIAEISANHGNSLDVLEQTVRGIAKAGADVVKTQTYHADTLTSASHRTLIEGTPWNGQYLYDLYLKGSMIWGYNSDVKKMAEQYGLGFLSTAYDPSSADYLIALGVDAIKVSSFELVDEILLRHLGRAKMPIVLSTGMAHYWEIAVAVRTYLDAGGPACALLRCNSSYPANPSDLKFAKSLTLLSDFTSDVGFSDHTRGVGAACCAVACGARIIEKHVCLDGLETIDSKFSLPLSQLGGYVSAIRDSFDALQVGSSQVCGPVGGEVEEVKYRKSLYAACHIPAGIEIDQTMVVALRPADGLSPLNLGSLIGSKAAVDIVQGNPIRDSDIAWKDR